MKKSTILLCVGLLGLIGFRRKMLPAIMLLLFVPVYTYAAAPVIDSFASSSTTVLPGEVVTLTVEAHDPDCSETCTTGCGLYIRADLTDWTATGGTFLSEDNGTSGSPYTATADWQAPATGDTYTLTVYLADSGNFICGDRQRASASIDVEVDIIDDDTDGYSPPEDCDDADPDVNPDADEICDGVDNDCNGRIDGLTVPNVPDVERFLIVGDFGDMDLTDLVVRITGGSGENQSRTIVDNNDAAALVNEEWLILPDSSSTYEVVDEIAITGYIDSAGNLLFPFLLDAWFYISGVIDPNALIGKTILITGGTGAGQEREIESIETVLMQQYFIIDSDWSVVPDVTSTYRIVTSEDMILTGTHDPFGDGYCLCDPSPEECDGVDNDCNGIIDDSPIDIDDLDPCTIDECIDGSILNSPVNVDDGISCTIDSCDINTGEIVNYPDDGYCDDGSFCNGAETCDAEIGCQDASPPQCSDYDLPEVLTCENDPDGNPSTWDLFEGFTSVCDEDTDSCTTGIIEVISSCSVDQCGAQCDSDSTWDNHCVGDERRFAGICDPDTCTWSYSAEDCSDNDNWYDTGNTRIVPVDQSPCETKEQKEQEYRKYTCSDGTDCLYSTTGKQWIDSGIVYSNDEDGDGVCTEYDDCVATPAGAVVNEDGCSIAELCPCTHSSHDAEWSTHGAYVRCIVQASKDFLSLDLMTKEESRSIISKAGRSRCGHRMPKP